MFHDLLLRRTASSLLNERAWQEDLVAKARIHATVGVRGVGTESERFLGEKIEGLGDLMVPKDWCRLS